MNEGDGFQVVKRKRRRAKKVKQPLEEEVTIEAGPNGLPAADAGTSQSEAQTASNEVVVASGELEGEKAGEKVEQQVPAGATGSPSHSEEAMGLEDAVAASPVVAAPVAAVPEANGPVSPAVAATDEAPGPNSSAAYCSNGISENTVSEKPREAATTTKRASRSPVQPKVDDGGWTTVNNKKKSRRKRNGGTMSAAVNDLPDPDVHDDAGEVPAVAATPEKSSEKKAKPEGKASSSSRSRRKKKNKGGAKKQEEGDLLLMMQNIIKTQDPQGQKLSLVDLANFLQEETKLSWNKNYKKTYGPLSAFLLRQEKVFVVLGEVVWLKAAAPKAAAPKPESKNRGGEPPPAAQQAQPSSAEKTKKSGRRKPRAKKSKPGSQPNSPIVSRADKDGLGLKSTSAQGGEAIWALLAFITFVALTNVVVCVFTARNAESTQDASGSVFERIRSWAP